MLSSPIRQYVLVLDMFSLVLPWHQVGFVFVTAKGLALDVGNVCFVLAMELHAYVLLCSRVLLLNG